MEIKRCHRILMVLQILLFGCTGFSSAQEAYFQGKTIRIIVGFPGGGGVDAEARMIARFLPPAYPGESDYRCAEHARRRRHRRE